MPEKIKYRFFLESENFGIYCSDYILDASGYAEIFPQYDDEFGIKWEEEQDQIFFRKQIDGELTFVNIPKDEIYDYNCLHFLPIDEEIYLHIFNNCDDYTEPIYTGYFTKRNMFWNENECIVTISNIIPYDKYPCILKNWETEYNIAGLPDYIVNRLVWPEIFEYCKRIAEVIQYLLDEMECGITYQSTFYENDLTVDTDNYVTGDDPNPLNDIMIVDKSNILAEAASPGHPGVFAPATISNLSLKTLLDTLKNLYDIRWHIDLDGWFRIEHISFYKPIIALGTLPLNDLTVLINEYTDREYAYRTNKYDYLNLPDREEFVYSEKDPNKPLGFNVIFEDYFFDYTYSNRSPGGTKNTKEVINHIISGFVNDLIWLCNTVPADTKASADGFAIFEVAPDPPDYEVDSNNQELSWIQLLNRYWQDYRPFIYAIRGYFDKASPPGWSVDTFNSKQRSKKQIPIEIHGCCDPFHDDFDIFDLIKTWLGNGEIYNFRYELSSGAVTVELLYEAEDIEEPILP